MYDLLIKHATETTSKSIGIDEQTAIKIATRFLEQHHCVIGAVAHLEGEQYLVTARIGFMPDMVKKVRIDGKSGKIIGCA